MAARRDDRTAAYSMRRAPAVDARNLGARRAATMDSRGVARRANSAHFDSPELSEATSRTARAPGHAGFAPSVATRVDHGSSAAPAQRARFRHGPTARTNLFRPQDNRTTTIINEADLPMHSRDITGYPTGIHAQSPHLEAYLRKGHFSTPTRAGFSSEMNAAIQKVVAAKKAEEAETVLMRRPDGTYVEVPRSRVFIYELNTGSRPATQQPAGFTPSPMPSATGFASTAGFEGLSDRVTTMQTRRGRAHAAVRGVDVPSGAGAIDSSARLVGRHV